MPLAATEETFGGSSRVVPDLAVRIVVITRLFAVLFAAGAVLLLTAPIKIQLAVSETSGSRQTITTSTYRCSHFLNKGPDHEASPCAEALDRRRNQAGALTLLMAGTLAAGQVARTAQRRRKADRMAAGG